MRNLSLLLVVACLGACHATPAQLDQPDAATVTADASTACAPGLAGAPCVIALYDRAAASCAAGDLATLGAELDARAGLGPLWADGRALFRTMAPIQIAGGWNNWSTTALASAPLCGGSLILAIDAVATGRWGYKLYDGTWSVDPQNPAFAYDDVGGINSTLDTPDSGLGHLVGLGQQCSAALGNCRNLTAYLPPGYDAPAAAAQRYPVMFMHDGQNVWDNHTCCFGHTGWEVNVTLDSEIAAGKVAPIIVIAADNTAARMDEYGMTASVMDTFMDFQVNQLQPAALALVRGDGAPVVIAGSSLGGLVSLNLALRYPEAYAGVASLSGSFWVGQDTMTAMRDQIPGLGKQPLAIYLDSGGALADDSDSAADTAQVRDLLVVQGWQAMTSPDCTRSPSTICYYLEPGATHDELAWKARVWRFLEFLFPAQVGH